MIRWAGFWFHMDGLVHVIGRHMSYTEGRIASSDCDLELACVWTPHEGVSPLWLASNTSALFPTCLACWHASNFGSYAPR